MGRHRPDFNFVKMFGMGELPKEYNIKIHGPYDPCTYYGPKGTPLSQTKIGQLPGWLARRNKSPAAIGRCMSRGYHRWLHRYYHPRYSGMAPFFQACFLWSGLFFCMNYAKISHHKNYKFHW